MTDPNAELDRFNVLPWRARLDRQRTAWFGVIWLGTLIITLIIQGVWFAQSIGQVATWSATDWSDQLLERETRHQALQAAINDQRASFDHHQAQITAHRHAQQALAEAVSLNGQFTDRLKAWVAMRPAGVWLDALSQTHDELSLDGRVAVHAKVMIEGHAIHEARVHDFWRDWQATIAPGGVIQGEVSVAPPNEEGVYPFSIAVEVSP